jgi:hypothetical protein
MAVLFSPVLGILGTGGAIFPATTVQSNFAHLEAFSASSWQCFQCSHGLNCSLLQSLNIK